jgi:hypothetical protein
VPGAPRAPSVAAKAAAAGAAETAVLAAAVAAAAAAAVVAAAAVAAAAGETETGPGGSAVTGEAAARPTTQIADGSGRLRRRPAAAQHPAAPPRGRQWGLRETARPRKLAKPWYQSCWSEAKWALSRAQSFFSVCPFFVVPLFWISILVVCGPCRSLHPLRSSVPRSYCLSLLLSFRRLAVSLCHCFWHSARK